jgi:uncharacterized protein
VHFEIPVDDAARAKEFYRASFEWRLDDADMGGGNVYTTVTTTPIDEQSRLPTEPGAINGGLMRRTAETPAPVITIGVDAIDDALKKVEAGGGGVVQPRTEIPEMGAFAYFKDSEGNVVGLWESVETEPSSIFPGLVHLVHHRHQSRPVLHCRKDGPGWQGRRCRPRPRLWRRNRCQLSG